MTLSFRLLLLHESKTEAAELAQKVNLEVPFIAFHTVCSEQDALECHVETAYDMCLVSEKFPDFKVVDLMKDLERLYAQKYLRRCVFVKVINQPPTQAAIDKAVDLGFRGVISTKVEEADREHLREFAVDMKHMIEVLERTADLGSTLQRVLAEVDRVSRDRKRGRNTKFNTISIDYLSSMVELEPSVFEKYLDNICTLTDKMPAPKHTKVIIPEALLRQKLPKLAASGYSGASSRVWKKLIEKYGVGEEEGAAAAAAAAPAEAATQTAPAVDILQDDDEDE